MSYCRSRSVYLDLANADKAFAGFIQKCLIRTLIHRSRSFKASRIVFAISSTSVVHHVGADPRRQLGMTSFTRVGPCFAIELVETIHENKNAEIVRVLACVDHWARCSLPMLLFRCLEFWVEESNIFCSQQIPVGIPG